MSTLTVTAREVRGGWTVTTTAGPAGAFHAQELPSPATRELWIHEPDGPALVLGSTQRPAIADEARLARRGVALVRRHSGGGAVLVEPGGLTWVDVVLPAGDPLWCRDVGEAFLWLGRCWAAALASLRVAATVHHGPLLRRPWSREVCFAGLGPGEVTAGAEPGGPKLVGIAQRRRRHAARFQCAALHRWDPASLVGLLRLDPAERVQAAAALAGSAAGITRPPGALLDAFVASLPT